MSKPSAYSRLTNLLSSVENAVLAASDRELLSDPQASTAAKNVRQLIQGHLTADAETHPSAIPVDTSERRRLLELVMRGNPRIPTEFRAAFSAKRQMSDGEVSNLLNKLLRSGLLGKPNKS